MYPHNKRYTQFSFTILRLNAVICPSGGDIVTEVELASRLGSADGRHQNLIVPGMSQKKWEPGVRVSFESLDRCTLVDKICQNTQQEASRQVAMSFKLSAGRKSRENLRGASVVKSRWLKLTVSGLFL